VAGTILCTVCHTQQVARDFPCLNSTHWPPTKWALHAWNQTPLFLLAHVIKPGSTLLP